LLLHSTVFSKTPLKGQQTAWGAILSKNGNVFLSCHKGFLYLAAFVKIDEKNFYCYYCFNQPVAWGNYFYPGIMDK
jgi:hypothetical protein